MTSAEHPVVLFDGVCNLCNGSILFIIKRDPRRRFRFASLQSEAGQALLREHHQPTEKFEAMILIENGMLFRKSSAALWVARRLSSPWAFLSIFLIVPPFLRDIVYDFIARRRYKWFGRQDVCMVPTPELKSLFL